MNRGFLRIPMLPLYGFGAVMMLWISLPVRENLLLVYLFGVISATALEYVTGYIMERLFRVRYWDYSAKRFQAHGYICLSSSIAWGFLTILMTEIIHGPIDRFVLGLRPGVLLFCISIVSAVFAADVFESTREALAIGKSLEAMTRLKAEMDELQARIAVLKEEAAEQMSVAREMKTDLLSAAREDAAKRLAAAKDETAQKLEAAKMEAAELLISVKNEAVKRLSAARMKTLSHLAQSRLSNSGKIFARRNETTRKLPASRSGNSILILEARLSAAFQKRKKELNILTKQLEDTKSRRLSLDRNGRLRRFYRRGLLKGNPGAVSLKFSEAFNELREKLGLDRV